MTISHNKDSDCIGDTISWVLGWIDGCMIRCFIEEIKDLLFASENDNEYIYYMRKGFEKGFENDFSI